MSLERRGHFALLLCDNPPLNLIGRSVRAGLHAGIRQVEADPGIEAAIILCRGRSFFAGADITEFGQDDTGPGWSEVDRAIDLCAKPILAAIHGNCLGGGFEIALACQYRIAEGTAVFGFPEVKLGLIPGAGGTQRFTRLAGFAAALDIIPSGRSIAAEEALRLGAIDRIAEGGLEADALAFAQALISSSRKGILPVPETGRTRSPGSEPELFDRARDNARRRYRGIEAPLRAIEAIENARLMDFEAAMAAETAIFRGCEATAQHRALTYLFFAERAARRVPGCGAGSAAAQGRHRRGYRRRHHGTRHLAGFRRAGHAGHARRVSVAGARRRNGADPPGGRRQCRQRQAERGPGEVAPVDDHGCRGPLRGRGGRSGDRGHLRGTGGKAEALRRPRRGHGAGRHLGVQHLEFDIDQIATATARPQDVIGLHFFSPANIMKLLEIVRGAKTTPEVVATALALAKRAGQAADGGRVCDGFIANRAFDSEWRQTRFRVEEGAEPYETIHILTFGMPHGPFAVNDLVGLDMAAEIRRNREGPAARRSEADRIEDELAAAGRWGRKTVAAGI